jgi:hypothetical protein
VGFSVSPCLAADDAGRVFLAWHDLKNQSDIYFTVYDGIVWSEPQNVTEDSQSSAFADMVIDSMGHLHLVWMNYGSDIEIYYTKYDGDLWSTRTNISHLEGYSVDPKIALDTQDQPHVVWEERKQGYHGYYNYYDHGLWHEAVKISAVEPLRVPEIVVDSRDVVTTVWTTAGIVGGEVYWNYYTGGAWSHPVDLSNSPESASGSPVMGVNMADSLHVIYVEWDTDNWEIFYTRRNATGVRDRPEGTVPRGYRLEQNYPNPFNSQTSIQYTLAGGGSGEATLRIYNLLGREVNTLVDMVQGPGDYEVSWDGRDNSGVIVSSGVYFCRLEAGGFQATRKMVVLR